MHAKQPTKAAPYFGAKGGQRGQANWIIDQLPPTRYAETYAEPFAGMLGVLLARQPATQEVINDLDGKITNFWRVLRDEPDQLAEMLAATEYGRPVFAEAQKTLHDPTSDNIRRAWALTICLSQSIQQLGASQSKPSNWSRTSKSSSAKSTEWQTTIRRITSPEMTHRLARIVVEQQDASKFIEFYGGRSTNVIYCDPPYQAGIKREAYNAAFDPDTLLEPLANATAKILISGYPGDGWEQLGWRETRRDIQIGTTSGLKPRTEILFANYPHTETLAHEKEQNESKQIHSNL